MERKPNSDPLTSFLEPIRPKSSFEIWRQDYFKAFRLEKNDSNRRRLNSFNSAEDLPSLPNSNSNGNSANFQSTRNPNSNPREIPDPVSKDSAQANPSGPLKSAKSLSLPVLSLMFAKANISSFFKKIYLKLQPGKDLFVFELEAQEGDPRSSVARAKIEISFSDVSTIGFTKEEEQISLEFRRFELAKDVSRKHVGPWTPCRFEELLAAKESIPLPEHKLSVLKLPKESFQKINNSKAKLIERLKFFGAVVKENQRVLHKTGKGEPSSLPIKEIVNAAELEDLRKRELTLANADKKTKLEAFKQIDLPRLSEANSKNKNCPVYSCFQSFPSVSALKLHISQHHKELEQNGLEIDQNGAMSYPDHILDRVLMAVKILPNFVSSYVLEEGKKLMTHSERTGSKTQN